MNWWQLLLLNAGGLVGGLVASVGVRAGVAYATTDDYYGKHVERARAAGFVERREAVREGLELNLAEGPVGGPPLLLIPGQGCEWHEYARVLPRLAESFHVVAVDVHGHGHSTWNPDDYTAARIADDLALLIERVFDGPVFVSGHSSGGLIAARLAATRPELVRGVVFEDPPFFSTEPERLPRTHVYLDAFRHVPGFLAQRDTGERDWVSWYLPRSSWRRMFGPLWPVLTRRVLAQRRADPERLPVIRWLSVQINRIWESMSHPYDPRFSLAFLDDSWFADFDQAETLAAVRAPSLFLKATTRFDRQGNLLAALSDDDLARAEALLPDNQTIRLRSSHDIHFAHPKRFCEALEGFAERIDEAPAGITG